MYIDFLYILAVSRLNAPNKVFIPEASDNFVPDVLILENVSNRTFLYPKLALFHEQALNYNQMSHDKHFSFTRFLFLG